MRRISNPQQHLLLTALPYLLLIGLLLLTLPFHSSDSMGTDWGTTWGTLLWRALRWLVRLLFITGAIVAWQRPQGWATLRDYATWQQRAWGESLWYFGWLGFGVYEVVAIGLSMTLAGLESLSRYGSVIILFGLALLAAAFLPYLLLTLWLGQRQRQLAAYTIFPYAALTIQLCYLALLRIFDPTSDSTFATLAMAPILLAGTVAVIFPRLTTDYARWWLLYGGMATCQLAFVVGTVIQEQTVWLLILVIPLSILGGLILSTVFIVPALLQIALQLCGQLVGAERLQKFTAWWARAYQAYFPQLVAFTARMTIKAPSAAPSAIPSVAPMVGATVQLADVQTEAKNSGERFMSERTPPAPATALVEDPQGAPPTPPTPPMSPVSAPPPVGPGLERLYKMAMVVLTAAIILGAVLFVGRSAVYKIHEYERGLHLRGGRFLAVQNPGWHIQIPLVDTVIIVKVNERLGYIERIAAMTSDNVTMIVSLQYTYRVTDPEQYALQVDDPERIVFEFVQGRLRDVVNTKAMADVMNNRALMNQEVMEILKDKESQYGVKFVTVQMQSASPPEEVLTAIKDRMVAIQRQEQAQAEAAQQRTVADAELYGAQKRAEATAYDITRTAEAEAERIRLMTEAQQLSIRSVLEELDGKGELATKFLDYLIAQELKENSKWVISGEGTPLVNIAP